MTLLFTGDLDKDMKSVHRCLDRKLILLVKHTLGEQDHWMLPQAVRNDEETMREVSSAVCQFAQNCQIKGASVVRC